MRALLLISLCLLVLGCGSRKKSLSKEGEKTSFNQRSNTHDSKSINLQASSATDIRSFLLSNGLKIKSTGQNYELKYGDITFSGSADLEFNEKKEETNIHHVYKVHTTYISDIKYQTKTFFKTDKSSKKLEVERKGISFGSMIWIVVVSLFVGALVSQLIILYFKNK